jgi:death on curing protein
MFYFTKDDIIYLHTKLIIKFGGSDGIRNIGMLESALSTPLQTFDSQDLYPTIIDKIARLSFGLVMDHPFIDGNKRIAAKVLDVGFSANNINLNATNEEMIKEFLQLASSKVSYQDFLSWIKLHI